MQNSIFSIDHTVCTGCMMCSDICAKNAISFRYDKGFWYPSVNEKLCINCGLCSKKCPILRENVNVSGPLSCYGAKSKDKDIRWNSTSGGVVSELAKCVIAEDGYCAGAVYSKDNEIVHEIGNDMFFVDRMRQSKYAQSNTLGIYKKAKYILNKGNTLLFCGCACQIEALKSYLGNDYENLITMDFICLGICSPIVYRKYLDYWEQKYRSKIIRVWFKNKEFGWRGIGVRLDFENGKVYSRHGGHDLFMLSFVGDTISIRKSCEQCKFRKIPHNSDLTVADFWGIENVKPFLDDNLGWSAVFVNTTKGAEWFDKISNNIDFFETTCNHIIAGNFSAIKPKKAGKNREVFLDAVENMPFNKALRKYGNSYSLFKELIIDLSEIRRRIKCIIKHLIVTNGKS